MDRRLSPAWIWSLHFCCILALSAAGCAPAVRSGPGSEQGADSIVTSSAESTLLLRGRHLARLGVDRWHEQGVLGEGVKVAILDTGFRGYRNFLGSSLPSRVQARSFRNDEDLEARDSQHGICCGEVVHTLAPRSPILLANWDADNPETFLAAVRWARGQGARIISCSVIMPSWSDGQGGGSVHRALDEFLGAGHGPRDLLLCASAGNTAQRHWTGAFDPDRRGFHQWAKGQTRNRITPWGRETVSVEAYGPNRTRCAIEVWSEEQRVGRARLQEDADHKSGRAVVRFEPDPERSYDVRLRAEAGSSPTEPIHVVALGGGLDISSAVGSVVFPADGARVIAVGAVNAQGHRTSYSSCGQQGRCLKPDFVATVPFPCTCRDRPFAGTSAAAPQVAALAALVWARHPEWTADQVRSTLRAAAEDLGPTGHDCETGHGLIRLPR